MSVDLFSPFALGDLLLANRMVMAPMTRNRAERDGCVPAMMTSYYQQRATAGLIITESTCVSPNGVGYPFTPGIYTDAQAMSWLRLTDAVHSAGGHIFVQLQYCARISHPSLLPNQAVPAAPSAIRPEGQAVTYSGMQDFVMPRALAAEELPGIVATYRRGAELGRRAGFDGIEVHGGNGYLVDQFLRDGTNHRTDRYGGTPRNRMRLLNEILDAVGSVWPTGRIGVRLTPENSFNSMSDSDPRAHFEYFVTQLGARKLAYLHVLEGDMMTRRSTVDYRSLRAAFGGAYMANNGYDFARGQAVVHGGAADLVAFGSAFLANPDLVRRYRYKLPLNEPNSATFYGGGEVGYVDYPAYRSEYHAGLSNRTGPVAGLSS